MSGANCIPWHRREGDYHRARLARGRRLYAHLLRKRVLSAVNPAVVVEDAVVAAIERGLYSRTTWSRDVAWSLMVKVMGERYSYRWPKWWGFVSHHRMAKRIKERAA